MCHPCLKWFADQVAEIVGSLAFVRTWHGFGLGRLRSQTELALTSAIPSEDRLLRFMQAQVPQQLRWSSSSCSNL